LDGPASRASDARYKIVDLLATGGMAEVYRADAHGLGGFTKRVAIKRVKPELVTDRKFVEMFLDEALLGARLNHSNCVQVFDVSQARDPATGEQRYFLVMEYVDGATLRHLTKWVGNASEGFDVGVAIYITIEMLKGLEYAHSLTDERGRPLGIVHRDVSPANVLITRHGEVKLADFGLAKAATQMNQSGTEVIKGKFSYLAPEAVRQRPLDGRADLFATGSILWELLAGQKLFQGESPAQIVARVERAEVPSLRDRHPEVDDALDAIVHKALARERDDRYGRARDMIRALNTWLASHRRSVCALDVAELVQTYRERRSQASGLLAIDAALNEVQAQLEHLDHIHDQTPDWVEEFPSFQHKPSDHARFPSLRAPSFTPSPLDGSEIERAEVARLAAVRQAKHLRTALAIVIVALAVAVLCIAFGWG
jgi:serine/threonine protein kinase